MRTRLCRCGNAAAARRMPDVRPGMAAQALLPRREFGVRRRLPGEAVELQPVALQVAGSRFSYSSCQQNSTQADSGTERCRRRPAPRRRSVEAGRARSGRSRFTPNRRWAESDCVPSTPGGVPATAVLLCRAIGIPPAVRRPRLPRAARCSRAANSSPAYRGVKPQFVEIVSPDGSLPSPSPAAGREASSGASRGSRGSEKRRQARRKDMNTLLRPPAPVRTVPRLEHQVHLKADDSRCLFSGPGLDASVRLAFRAAVAAVPQRRRGPSFPDKVPRWCPRRIPRGAAAGASPFILPRQREVRARGVDPPRRSAAETPPARTVFVEDLRPRSRPIPSEAAPLQRRVPRPAGGRRGARQGSRKRCRKSFDETVHTHKLCPDRPSQKERAGRAATGLAASGRDRGRAGGPSVDDPAQAAGVPDPGSSGSTPGRELPRACRSGPRRPWTRPLWSSPPPMDAEAPPDFSAASRDSISVCSPRSSREANCASRLTRRVPAGRGPWLRRGGSFLEPAQGGGRVPGVDALEGLVHLGLGGRGPGPGDQLVALGGQFASLPCIWARPS